MTAQAAHLGPGTPNAEVEIDAPLLRGLLEDQMPELATLPIATLDEGWDNVSFRVGSHRVVRMPRREVAVANLINEQRWLPRLAPSLPIPVPAPVAIGTPGRGYPWPFSVVPYLPGQTADLDPPAADQSELFAHFLRALHRPADPDAPPNPYRGVPLADVAPRTVERLARLRVKTHSVTPAIDAIWQAALAAPLASDDEATWLHGDLHAKNVLVEEGSLTGIIDWGDITCGDPATDLAAIWIVFDDARSRRRAIEAYDIAESTLLRARGWAIFFGAVLFDSGLVDHPRHAAIGEATLRHLTQDAA